MAENRARPPGYGEVLAAWSWYDCPRAGLAVVNGEPHRFICEFDEELDDYPDEYRVWPVSDATVQAELAFWRVWSDWRGRFDSGADPGRLEDHPQYESLRVGMQYDDIPPDARHAVPEWRLDRNRSFAGRMPRHLVSWAFTEST